jgi:uncharacterized protein
MTDYYFDTSALVKRYLVETGTLWVRSLFAARNDLIMARITHAELASTFARRVREGTLSASDEPNILRLFHYHLTKRLMIVEIDADICTHAATLSKSHALRGYDSVQLACAIKANDLLIKVGAEPLTFLTADKALLKAAANEGLITDNPDNH